MIMISTFYFIMPEALSGIFAALGFIFALSVACCIRSSHCDCKALCVSLLRATFDAKIFGRAYSVSSVSRITLPAAVNVDMCGSPVRQPQPNLEPRVLSVRRFALRLVVVLRVTVFRSEKCIKRLFYYYYTIVKP